MQQDADLLDALHTDLAELTALHAPSGSEQPVIARLRDLFTPLVDAVAVDHMGNLTAMRVGPHGAPHVVVSAHADEIGAIVTSIESEGFLRLAPLGGVQSRLLEGRAVWVGGHPGVIGARSGHLTPQGEQGRGVSIADLYVDLGVDDAAAVEALGVRVGDPLVVISELRTLAGTRVAGKGIDNRASCVILLHLLRRLKEQPLPCRLTALVAVQEEVGLRGATAAFARLQPDLAIVLDTPSMLVDLTLMEANIASLMGHFRAKHVHVRPHLKTVKSPELAHILLAAGAVGGCVAKVSEAEVMAQAGIEDLLITSEIVGKPKLARLVALQQQHPHIKVVVDSLTGAEQLNQAMRDAQLKLNVLLDLNVGQNRCGVMPGEAALALARHIGAMSNLHLIGVQGYEGHLQHLHDPVERAQS